MNLDLILLVVLVVGALWTVMAADLLKSALGLAATSAILAVIMFRFMAPLAAVFELSVCAGLITVIFVSVISLTRPGIVNAGKAKRFGRYIVLPLVVLIAGIALSMIKYQPDLTSLLAQAPETDMRRVLWGERQLDLFGQVVVLLTGIFGVVVLFKERDKRK
ncbi:MAG: hypothetical protein Q7J98_01895 [Kiritimatiellia bacterium]|nr:hypothetical protein [Kiritimatiellia bacterium]